MTEFVLKNNFFKFNSKTKQLVSGAAIITKFVPPYACLFMDKFKKSFLETQCNAQYGSGDTQMIFFFIWMHHDEENLTFVLKSLNEFYPCINFSMSPAKKVQHFLK